MINKTIYSIFALFFISLGSDIDTILLKELKIRNNSILLFKDTISNQYKFIKDNHVINLNYDGSNYLKLLDSNSYEFKEMRLYQAAKTFSAFGSIGLSLTVAISIISSYGTAYNDSQFGISTIGALIGFGFGIIAAITDKISEKAINNIILKPKTP